MSEPTFVTIKLYLQQTTRRFRLSSVCSYAEFEREIMDLCKLRNKEFRILDGSKAEVNDDAAVHKCLHEEDGQTRTSIVRLYVELTGKAPSAAIRMDRKLSTSASLSSASSAMVAESASSEDASTASAVFNSNEPIADSVVATPTPVSNALPPSTTSDDLISASRNRVKQILSRTDSVWTLEFVRDELNAEPNLRDLVDEECVCAMMKQVVDEREAARAKLKKNWNKEEMKELEETNTSVQVNVPSTSVVPPIVADATPSSIPPSIESAARWSCLCCTFLNPLDATRCEMCTTSKEVACLPGELSITSVDSISSNVVVPEPVAPVPIEVIAAPAADLIPSISPPVVILQPSVLPASIEPQLESIPPAQQPPSEKIAPESILSEVTPTISPSAEAPVLGSSAISSSGVYQCDASLNSLSSSLNSSTFSSAMNSASIGAPSPLDLQCLTEQIQRVSQQLQAISPAVNNQGFASPLSAAASMTASSFMTASASSPSTVLAPIDLVQAVSSLTSTVQQLAVVQQQMAASLAQTARAQRTASWSYRSATNRRSRSSLGHSRSSSRQGSRRNSMASSQELIRSRGSSDGKHSNAASTPSSPTRSASSSPVVISSAIDSPSPLAAPTTNPAADAASAVGSVASPSLPSTATFSPSIQSTEFDIDAYVNLNMSTLNDFSLHSGQMSAVLDQFPPGAPQLQTIPSVGEAEKDDEKPTVLPTPTSVLSPVVEAATESMSPPSAPAEEATPVATTESSTSIAASSASPPVDLAASFLLEPLSSESVSTDLESKLAALAALGFTNRVFCSTLLSVNEGDMDLTIQNLKQFYNRTQ